MALTSTQMPAVITVTLISSAQNIKQPDRTLVLPVAPENISFNMGRGTIDVPLWRLGTVSRPGPKQPLELTFAGLLPHPAQFRGPNGPRWLSVPLGQMVSPWSVREQLRLFQNGDRKGDTPPLKLILSAPANLSLRVIMTQCDIETAPPHDLRYTITVREHALLPKIKKVKRGPRDGSKPVRRVNEKAPPRFTRTRANENLMQVAKRVYGTTGRGEARILFGANKKVIGKDYLRKLPKGTKLRVPDIIGIKEKL